MVPSSEIKTSLRLTDASTPATATGIENGVSGFANA